MMSERRKKKQSGIKNLAMNRNKLGTQERKDEEMKLNTNTRVGRN